MRKLTEEEMREVYVKAISLVEKDHQDSLWTVLISAALLLMGVFISGWCFLNVKIAATLAILTLLSMSFIVCVVGYYADAVVLSNLNIKILNTKNKSG